jgi:anti-anti-sigma factor
MYTDGVTEALDAREGAVLGGPPAGPSWPPPASATRGISPGACWRGWPPSRATAPQADDIALLVLRRGPAGLRLASRLSELPRLAVEVARLGREHDLPEEVVSDLTLALEEAVSNVIRHGYGERPDGLISVTFPRTGESIVVTVEDAAVGFDPLKHPEPDLSRSGGGAPRGRHGRLPDQAAHGRSGLSCGRRAQRADADEADQEGDVPLTVVSEQGTAGIHIVRPAGSLDSNTSSILEDHLAGLRRDGATTFVLDLKNLTYISSAGVRVILVAKKAMKAAGGDVALTNLQPQIRKVFDIIQALPSLNVFESVADLDRYLAGIQKKVREEGA